MGKGQGGQIDTAGYALWALDNGGRAPDETTAAVTEFLLQFQNDQEHYQPQSRRPPTEQSHFTSSYVALRGLKSFGTTEQRERIDARTARVTKWLLETIPEDTEDRVFRLRALHLVGAPEADRQRASDELLKAQRDDGGWSQLPDLSSDAYATGTVLVALQQTGALAGDSAAYRKGLNYLISTQKPDGSWHVVSRSKPFQTYFESGYPHGKDQFISSSAAGWATTALVLSLPVEQAK
jgi:N-acyl-D-amino-acid deacylase